MRIYEAIVKGLEGIGVTAAFGGAGENAAGLMIALKHSQRIRPVIARHEQAMNDAACSCRAITGRIRCECFNAITSPAAFSPAPPNAAVTPMLSRPLTMASYTLMRPPQQCVIGPSSFGLSRAGSGATSSQPGTPAAMRA